MLATGTDSDAEQLAPGTPEGGRPASPPPAARVDEGAAIALSEPGTPVTKGLVDMATGAACGPAPEPLIQGIERLKKEQAALRAQRKRVARELKNAEKRRTRLKKRARNLSDGDLLAVLQMRDTQPEQAQSSGSASSGSVGSPASAAAAHGSEAARGGA